MAIASSAETPLGGRDTASATPDELVRLFEKEIRRQEDILFGVALFFRGIELLYAGQESVIETYRKQFRNIERLGRNTLDNARALLEQARRDESRAPQLRRFTFFPCEGHPDAPEMKRRALAMVEAYRESHPDRARDKPLEDRDVLELVERAGVKLHA